ncbi:hypothetical protein ACK389_05520 [Streptomyces antibioticus]|uniref:hypothetical protein n=2 Tax=Streptomyces TaxID=1883 RepID=UPI0033C893BE
MTDRLDKPANTAGANKFDLINVITISSLRPEDKVLLIELVMRWNKDTGQLNPSVERLAKARGIKHAKNFKGADAYLPGLVTKQKVGRKNHYVLNVPGIINLAEGKVNLSHYTSAPNTPAMEGVSTSTPAPADNTPSTAGVNNPSTAGVYTPSMEGSNNSRDSSVDSSSNNGGVTHVQKDNQGSPLVETKSPLVIPGEVVIEEIGISPLVDVVDAPASPAPGETKKSRASFIPKSRRKDVAHVPASLDASVSANGAQPEASEPEASSKPSESDWKPLRRVEESDDDYNHRVLKVMLARDQARKDREKIEQAQKVMRKTHDHTPNTSAGIARLANYARARENG